VMVLGPIVAMVYRTIVRRSTAAAFRRPARLAIRRARFVEGMPIAEIPESSVVRIKGAIAQLGSDLRGPLGGRPCAYWRVVVSVRRYSAFRTRFGGRYSYWQESLDHSETTPFVLADRSGECIVDPTLATVSVRKRTIRVIEKGQAMPSRLAALLAEHGMSIDELRNETWRFEETIAGVGATVVVVGAARRTDRSRQGERDYRASHATQITLDGRDVELLITDNRQLLRRGPRADPTTLDPRERWQGPSVAEPEQESVPLDEYEQGLRAKRRRARIAVFGTLAIGMAVLGVLAVRGMPSHEPATLAPVQIATLRDLTQQQRIAARRSEDAWRQAFERRAHVTLTAAPCVRLAAVPIDTALPIASADRSELPASSPRTSKLLALLDERDRQFPSASEAQYDEQLQLATGAGVEPLDVVVERDGDSTILWLYDHDARRIVCRGEASQFSPSTLEVFPRDLGSLRAVR
jgi:hypothetical protein